MTAPSLQQLFRVYLFFGGVLRVDAIGAVKWSVDTDVVEDSNTDAKGNLTSL